MNEGANLFSFKGNDYQMLTPEQLNAELESKKISKSSIVTVNGRMYQLLELSSSSTASKVQTVKARTNLEQPEIQQPRRIALSVEGPMNRPKGGFDVYEYSENTGIPLSNELDEISKRTTNVGQELKSRRKELVEQQNNLAPAIEKSKQQNAGFYKKVDHCLTNGKLVENAEGQGGAYFLKDENGKNQFMVKPGDQDIYCFNNSKQNNKLENNEESQVRAKIPLYNSVQNEALASAQADLAGLGNVVPKTMMMVIENDQFHDLTDTFFADHKELDAADFGVTKKKLCSVQEFVPGAQDLMTTVAKGRDSRIDQTSFEDAMILTWMTYDNDGHGGNYLTYPLKDEKGNPILGEDNKPKLGLKKIDSGLSNPDINFGLRNTLRVLSQSQKNLSPRAKKLIAAIPVYQITKKMKEMGKSDESIFAFKQRMEVLKEVANQKNITIKQVQFQMVKKLNEKIDF